MSIYQSLKDKVESYLSPEQCIFVNKAYKFAYIAHAGVTRASGEPYITHPVAVAEILADMKLDHEAITAALLHDVIEDTEITYTEIVNSFTQTVADLVEGMTKLDKINFKNPQQAQAENTRKMLIAMSKDFRVMIIKLADRVHNMRTLGSLRPDKRYRIAQETFEIFAPIADRLGVHALKNELEHLAFKAQHPTRYDVLKISIKKARGNRQGYLQSIIDEISTALNKVGIQASVIGREKHLYSIYRKMQNKSCQFHDVMDVYAFRIVVKDFDACYRVLGQMHHLYQPKIEHFEDYIALPKPNSYQSLHTTLVTQHGINIEIQIRTEDMDNIAKQGIAAHWSYKSGNENSNLIAQLKTRNWFQGLIDNEDNTASSLVMLDNIKKELGNYEIHALTPQGRIVVLPAQATAIDFAYAVHTDLGNTCIGAKVDGEYSLLSNKLESGQTVKILTSKESHPNAEWLNFVATYKARNGIRQFLKLLPKSVSIPDGKRLLKQALGTTRLADIPQENINQILKDQNLETFDDLLHEIGSGQKLSILVARLLRGNTRELTESDRRQQGRLSAIKGTENMMVSYASCCKPVAGDKIVAHVTPGKGVVVHCHDCHNVEGFESEHDKFIAVEWDMDFTNQYEYSAGLTILMINHKAGLAKLFNVISKSNANVMDIQTNELPDHVYAIEVTLTVLNRVHLSSIIRKLKKIVYVKSVKRARQQRFADRRVISSIQPKEPLNENN